MTSTTYTEQQHDVTFDLAYWADMAFLTEKARVATQVRIAHLAKTNRHSPDTEEFLAVAQGAEGWVDKKLAQHILNHPTWTWASRVKGLGKENFPKVVGLVEKFARYYDEDDPMIPPYVHRPLETYYVVVEGKPVEKTGIWVAGMERLPTPSKFWKYAGLSVDSTTGKAERRARGQKLSYNIELRMSLFRLATSLMRATGVWYGRYEQARQELIAKKEAQGIKIMTTPKGRYCYLCEHEVNMKAARFCPDCNEPLSQKTESEGVLFQGHLHAMALREMTKDFCVCLWLIWRESLGLPITQPYKVVHLSHQPIDPWSMVDREP